MNLEKVACGNCGASLNVPDGVRFVSCLHCGSSLKVSHNESVAFTEVVERLEEHAGQIAELQEQVQQQSEVQGRILLDRELQALDQEWEKESQTLMQSDERGKLYPPFKLFAFLKAVTAGTVGVFCFVVAAQIRSHPPNFTRQNSAIPESTWYFLTGLAVFVVFGGMALKEFIAAHRYERLQDAYKSRREDIMLRIRNSVGSNSPLR